MSRYESVKKWREKNARNKTYNADFMRERRAYYKNLWEKKSIAWDEIPRSYRVHLRKSNMILDKMVAEFKRQNKEIVKICRKNIKDNPNILTRITKIISDGCVVEID